MSIIEANTIARCPHCGVTSRFEYASFAGYNNTFSSVQIQDVLEAHYLYVAKCVACGRAVISLSSAAKLPAGDTVPLRTMLVHPFAAARSPLPDNLPKYIADDYLEATAVLNISPKSSAALSRRCLQAVLRENGFTQSNLSKQIDQVLPVLPAYLAKDLDVIRHLGNFAAHPAKSTTTGEIVDVEPGEAEWNLDVLDLLFDFFYVQPILAQQRRDAINNKLIESGKQPMS